MQTLYEFSRHITGLKNEEKYSEALSFFKKNKENYTNKQITNNEYIVSAILTCLRKTQQIEAGFIFLSRYNIPLDENQKESVLNAYGWLLRAKYLQENGGDLVNEDESRFFQDDEENDPQESNEDNKNGMVQEIEALLLLLLRLKSKFSQTLISSLFTAIIKVEGKKNNPNWKMINEFCDRYDAEFLSKECFIIQVQKKVQITDMELASAFETWYSYKTKALFKLGKWQECYSTSVKAFESIEKFHYSNELWIARRMAISKKNLGNIDDAIADLEEVLKRKKEWYIKKELAELYFEKNDMARSYGLATEAANSPGPVEFKVELLMLLGRILKKKAKPN